jgi:hypothetical protein
VVRTRNGDIIDLGAVIVAIVFLVVVLAASLSMIVLPVTWERAVAGLGVMTIVWGQLFLVLGFVAAWKVLFENGPLLTGSTQFGDAAALVVALAAAPTWLTMVILGVLLVLAGAWVFAQSGVRPQKPGNGAN